MGGEDFILLTSSDGWNALFRFGPGTSPLVILPICFAFFFFVILFPFYFGLGFIERKLAADLQARVGPNRTPGAGILQVLADILKLGSKRVIRVELDWDPRWYALQNAILYSSFAFIPFGTSLVFLDSEIGAYLPFLCLGGFFLCSLFANEGARDFENEIMAQRKSFLWISAWIPALLATSTSIERTGTARWSSILSSQSNGIFHWTVFSSPFGFISFFVFILSGLVAFQLPPFHTLDRGVRHRAGASLGLFGLNQFYLMFAWCLLATALFLGGQPISDPVDVTFLIALYQLLSALIKASFISIILRVVAKALPQLRQDQMTDFCWRVLTPVALLCLIGELIWVQIFPGGVGA